MVKKGFTLIELLIALGIASAISSLVAKTALIEGWAVSSLAAAARPEWKWKSP